MVPVLRPIVLILLLSATLFGSDDLWKPQRVPQTGTVPLILYYQQFLRTNPFNIDLRKNTEEQRAENRRRHHRAAELYAAMSNAALKLAQSETLLPAAPEGIKKEKSEKIHGTWNLYQNVPINAADLRDEGLWMNYESLSHQVSLDPNKINAMYDFVCRLKKSTDHFSLYQDLTRRVCLQTLSFAHRPLKDHADKNHADEPDEPLPSEEALARHISLSIKQFAPFVQQFPNEENIKRIDAYFDTIELFRAEFPDSQHLAVWTKSFFTLLATIQDQNAEPLVLEYAFTYEGILRRWNLLGNPMPIWGTDLEGTIFDDETLNGKVVLLDFWATWCGPCLAEIPHLKLLYEKYKDRGFDIIGYSVDSDEDVLRRYLAKNPVPWIVLSKESSERSGRLPLSLHYGAKALPVVLLRDQSGNAVLLDARGEKLDDMMEILFKE